MQLSEIELIPTCFQVWEVDCFCPIKQDCIFTCLFVFWCFWFTECDLYIFGCCETYIEWYAWDLSNCWLADYFCHLCYAWQCKWFVQTYNDWTSQWHFHINCDWFSWWVDYCYCNIAIHRFECIKIDLIPFALICFKVDTFCYIQQLCTVTCIVCVVYHVYAEVYCAVCCHFNINLCHIIAN